MKLHISTLRFQLPSNLLQKNIKKLDKLSENLRLITKNAGTENKKYQQSELLIRRAIKNKVHLTKVLDEPIKIRALAILLQSEYSSHIDLDQSVLNQIDKIRLKPSSLLVQSVYQYYLKEYNNVSSYIANWLIVAMKKKGLYQNFHSGILGLDGPHWLAKQCVDNKKEFLTQLKIFDLENYSSGQFLTVAKKIYFVEQLKTIPINKKHPLLQEIKKQSVYDSLYDKQLLLGHKILEILIKRAPVTGIHNSWLNVIMTIAGDPRVPKTHINYQKWWRTLEDSLIDKVKGWLSHLDLRLFLEALENYSLKLGNSDMKRMYPARKKFLEGLLDKKMIKHTRLYLTSGFISYLCSNYKPEDLPSYSKVTTGSISVIYIQLNKAHMIEGSHSCQLWVYRSLQKSATVLDYSKSGATYSSLTSGLNNYKRNQSSDLIDNIVHYPPLLWQHKAIKALNKAGESITGKDVVSKEDYKTYKQHYGVV